MCAYIAISHTYPTDFVVANYTLRITTFIEIKTWIRIMWMHFDGTVEIPKINIWKENNCRKRADGRQHTIKESVLQNILFQRIRRMKKERKIFLLNKYLHYEMSSISFLQITEKIFFFLNFYLTLTMCQIHVPFL